MVNREDIPANHLGFGFDQEAQFNVLVPSSAGFFVKARADGYETAFYVAQSATGKSEALVLEPKTTQKIVIALRPVKQQEK